MHRRRVQTGNGGQAPPFRRLEKIRGPTTSLLVVVLPSRRPVHGDTTVQALREDVIGRQGHQHVVTVWIHCERVRGSRGERGTTVERVEGAALAADVEGRNHLDKALALRVDDADHRASWLVAGGEVVASVAAVEPDFVVSRDSGDYRVDGDRKSTRLNSSHLVISYAV